MNPSMFPSVVRHLAVRARIAVLGVAYAINLAIVPALQATDAFAVAFDGKVGGVAITLASPPAADYTLSAWVNLSAGGTIGGTRMAVLSSTGCGDSIEVLLRANTDTVSDPQYLELGRCNYFNGFASTQPVALGTWTHLAVTFGADRRVSYFVNGNPAGSFVDSDPSHDYSLGAHINLGDNTGGRHFNGMLQEVRIWSRVLTSGEIRSTMNLRLHGDEPGLYAYYPCDEGTSARVNDRATAAGGSAGVFVDGTLWSASPVVFHAPAAVTAAGSLADLGRGWRTPSIPKPLDLDADDVLGSDGFYIASSVASFPAYIGSVQLSGNVLPSRPGYATLDSPSNPSSAISPGTFTLSPGKGVAGDLLQFGLGPAAAGRALRVGVLLDNSNPSSSNPASIELLQAGESGPGPVDLTPSTFHNGKPDWVFFDIRGAAADDLFTLRAVGGSTGVATIGGLSFDSIAPPWTNSHGIVLPTLGGSAAIPSTPYPSRIAVEGLGDWLTRVTVTVTDINVPTLGDLDLLLVAPNGQTVLLVSNPGIQSTVNHVTLTFDDAVVPPPLNASALSSGTYRPFASAISLSTSLPPGAPVAPYGSALGTLYKTNPNGIWSLYARQRGKVAAASIGGWGLSIEAVPSVRHVTTLSDLGPGSLRDAIARSIEGTVIDFPGLSGTLGLANGPLVIQGNLTVAGPGSRVLAVSGKNKSRVFEIAPNATVTLAGLTIRDGQAPAGAAESGGVKPAPGAPGGGILNQGTLTLADSIITSNRAGDGGETPSKFTTFTSGPGGLGGGIMNLGTLTITRCVIVSNSAGTGGLSRGQYGESAAGGDGGGVFNGGGLTMTGSTVVSNRAGLGGEAQNWTLSGGPGGFGGGICNTGTLVMSLCTLAGNAGGAGGVCPSLSVFGAGGIGGSGGALCNSGVLRLTSCSIAWNTAGEGGMAFPRSSSTPVSSGSGGSGGGVLTTGTAELSNTLIAQNSPGAAGDLNPPPDGNYKGNRGSNGSSPDVSGTLTSHGHNLVGNGDGAPGISSGSAQDLVGTPDAPYGGIVAPLADNGGPTPTLALMPGSLAIGQGDGTLTGDDQRGPGFPRRVGAAVDIGAFESLFVGPVILGEFIQPPLRSLSTLLSTSELGIQVGMEGFSIQAWLEYGITPAYGARITPPPAGPEVPVRSVAATLIIAPGVLYHYRWVVRDYVDTVYGPDHTISSSGPALVAGDLNGDGIIQESELALVVSNYWVNLPRPQMTNVVGLGETNVSFSVPAPLLVGFEVQSSTNMVDWEYVGPATPRFEFLDSNAPGVPQRFYRLLSPNPYAAVHVPRP